MAGIGRALLRRAWGNSQDLQCDFFRRPENLHFSSGRRDKGRSSDSYESYDNYANYHAKVLPEVDCQAISDLDCLAGVFRNHQEYGVKTKSSTTAIVLALSLWFPVFCPRAAEVISLAGQWRFALDREDIGTNKNWSARELPDKIRLPGILQGQGYGDNIRTNTPWVLTLGDSWWKLQPAGLRERFSRPGHVEVPFLSQPPKHYLGVAWYQRDVVVPEDWRGRHVTLFLERAHWQSTVWVNEHEFPANESLVAPHITDLGVLTPGTNRISIRVDNRLRLPAQGHLVDSHSISDALGAAWNGIVGRIELRSTPLVWIDDVQVFPDVSNKTARMVVDIGNLTGDAGNGTLSCVKGSFSTSSPMASAISPVDWQTNGGKAEITVPLGDDAQMWDEFNPALQKFTVILDNEGAIDSFEVTFGLREITADDKDILINGRRVNLRMTHFGGDFPLTGYPATDVASWKKIIQVCKDYGLNGMRFHSWCPPEAAFMAADEMGFYLQPECGLWADFGSPVMRQWLNDETARLLASYGNHPSFILLSPSNEPRNYSHFTPQWAKTNYAQDNRRLYSAGTGWGDPSQVNGGAQYAALAHFHDGQLRGSAGWFGRDYREALTNVHIPVLAHEVGQWCAYPDFEVMKKFTGYLRPGNYDIFKFIARQEGVLDEDRDFAWASGRFQLECYKEEIEANLRTPGLAGFELLDLHDYLGQGTALIGLLDAFWESKGYVTPEEFRRFCGPVVPLARLTKRVFTDAEKFEVPAEVANFSGVVLTNAQSSWEMCDSSGKVVAHDGFSTATIPIGKNFALGNISADLSKLRTPAAYKLIIRVRPGANGSNTLPAEYENDWNFWVYAAQIEDSKSSDVLVTGVWSDAEKKLAASGKVLFMPTSAELDPTRCPPMRNVPIFWNIQMTVRPPQNPRPKFDAMLGLLCETNHPALAEFPTDKNCDWQWTQLVNGVRSVNLTGAPKSLRPIVWAIDDWNRNWRLGVIFECNAGPGRLLVSAIHLDDEDGGAEIRQLRRSLLDYMEGERFRPAARLTLEQVRGLWRRNGNPSTGEPARVLDPDLDDGSVQNKVRTKH